MEKHVDFDGTWSSLNDVTRGLIGGKCRLLKHEWNDRISDVYDLCVAQPRPFVGVLYKNIKNLFDDYVVAVYQETLDLVGSDLLVEYFHIWQAYNAAVPYLNRLYSYLNIQLAKRKAVDIDYGEHGVIGITCNERRLEVGELALNCWERGMVQNQKTRLVNTVLNEICRDRQGATVNQAAIQGVILSFVELLQFQPDNQLQLYEDLFEIPFFSSSEDFYVQLARSLRDNSDCSSFMEKALLAISNESMRIRRYLHPATYQRFELDCHSWLLCDDNIDYINDNCRTIVRRERWNDLTNLCLLLYSIEDGLDAVVSEFEEYLSEMSLAIMESLQADTTPAQFVEAIVEFHSVYSRHIRRSLGSMSPFIKALDKACYFAVNYRTHPKAHCKSPELLSRYCDELLRKSSKGISEMEMDEKLSNVITIFNYLEERDVFQQFYGRSLAKRLILNLSQSMDAEESMLNRLKGVCGYEYTSKLNRMFTDVTISADLNQRFSEYTKDAIDRQLPFTVTLSILQAGVWPIDHSNIPSFSLPPEMEKSVRIFELFYNDYYCGRKLTWMFHMSHVDLRFAYRKRPYIVSMEMHTMGVLLPFNTTDTISYRDLRDITQLPDKELVKHLQLLVDTKILLTSGRVTEESVFHLNLHYSNRRTKFKVLPTSQVEVLRETVHTHIAVEGDRRLFIQAAIVRIMKARRELKHTLLVQEVLNQARGRFTPLVSAIKKCIETLIEKQYLERLEDNKDTYVYIA